MNYSKKDFLLGLSCSLFLISFAIVFTVFYKPLYSYCIDAFSIDQYVSMSKEVLLQNYDVLIDYQSIFYRGVLELPNFEMSTNGRIHFEEVKRLFEMIQILCITTFCTSLYFGIKRWKEKEYRFLELASKLALLIPGIIGTICMVNFDQAFIIFHKIFFRNDYWIFDYRTDPVILILPQDFFMYGFIMIVVIILACSIMTKRIYQFKVKKLTQEI